MLILENQNVILWEAESIINNVILKYDKDYLFKTIEFYMQEEPFYGDPDYSYY
jgi:hypothetical protein